MNRHEFEARFKAEAVFSALLVLLEFIHDDQIDYALDQLTMLIESAKSSGDTDEDHLVRVTRCVKSALREIKEGR